MFGIFYVYIVLLLILFVGRVVVEGLIDLIGLSNFFYLRNSIARDRGIAAYRAWLPLERIRDRERMLDDWSARLVRAMQKRVQLARKGVEVFAAQLDSLSPLNVLARGYSLTRTLPDKHVVHSVTQAEVGYPVEIILHDGRLTVNSLIAAAGVPDHIRAAWCGHTVAVNVKDYTHARPEDMAVALAALTKIETAVRGK